MTEHAHFICHFYYGGIYRIYLSYNFFETVSD